MNHLLIYFLAIGFTIIYSIVETKHDYWVILSNRGYNQFSKKWHQWGFIQNLLAFVPLTVALFVYDWQSAIPLTIAIAFLFWQLHDSLIGYYLDQGFFLLGGTSKFDKFLYKTFQGGVNVAIIRIIFFFMCSTIAYFRLIP